VEFQSIKDKVQIICPKHGVFLQTPFSHYQGEGQGCPKCRCSKGEKKIMEYLSRNGVIYEYQKKFDGLRNKNPLPFDFYIPDSNICIEYDGQQHFEPIDAFGGLESFNKLKDNDAKKDEFCEIRGIELIRISYLNFDLIDSILKLSLHLNNL